MIASCLRHPFSIATLLAVIACGGTTTVEDDGGGGSSAGGAGASSSVGGSVSCPSTGGCQKAECQSLSDCSVVYACPDELACDIVEFRRLDEGMAVDILNPDALACVLGGLRDGTPGAYEWYITDQSIPGQFSDRTRLVLRDSGLGVVIKDSTFDLSFGTVFIGPTPVMDAAYFEGCQMLSSGQAAFECLDASYDEFCGNL